MFFFPCFQNPSRPWGVSVQQAVQNSPLRPSVLVPWRASCRQPRWVDSRDGGFSVVKIKPGWEMFVADFFLLGKNDVKWYDYIIYLWFELQIYIFRFFCSLRIFSPIKNSMTPICWFPWGEFGGHWPNGLVLIQSQMVPSNETWTALVDCLGKASCWQRALDHTLEGTFMAGTLLGGTCHSHGVGDGWGLGRLTCCRCCGRCVWLVIGGGCVVFFLLRVCEECKVLKVFI